MEKFFQSGLESEDSINSGLIATPTDKSSDSRMAEGQDCPFLAIRKPGHIGCTEPVPTEHREQILAAADWPR